MSNQAFQAFKMQAHLIGLHVENFNTTIESIQNKGRSDADWIIAIKDFENTHALHGHYWEKHPKGDETLLLLSGKIVLSYCDESFQNVKSIVLQAGEVLVVAKDTWHRLEVHHPGQLMFFTPAQGSKIVKVQEQYDV
ncbi:hypothetical protein [Acinetobacter rudis]|uniref:Cupin domain-containing protein n=1 Tax=Acinetobacter rudis TaxID=632955 RepID=A0AAW8JBU2_9GAMM|nr:hypothetical protein [Acinetobacter rudis]MDQ8936689.1 hypothetical protein [Acinetobacter rudis]MDQ8952399.1 hypothetical protein [Acinetobacter rudis]MDQ9018895.1 hypothetical protein [Acinetobacter rudis]